MQFLYPWTTYDFLVVFYLPSTCLGFHLILLFKGLMFLGLGLLQSSHWSHFQISIIHSFLSSLYFALIKFSSLLSTPCQSTLHYADSSAPWIFSCMLALYFLPTSHSVFFAQKLSPLVTLLSIWICFICPVLFILLPCYLLTQYSVFFPHFILLLFPHFSFHLHCLFSPWLPGPLLLYFCHIFFHFIKLSLIPLVNPPNKKPHPTFNFRFPAYLAYFSIVNTGSNLLSGLFTAKKLILVSLYIICCKVSHTLCSYKYHARKF